MERRFGRSPIDHLGAGDKYPEIAALNTDVLGDRPGFLKPGWVLNLPVGDQQGQSGDHTVTVQRGDTLSGIALKELGDPSRYPQIFHESQAIAQPGGAHLSDPNLIDAGWKLTIPADITQTKSSGPEPAKTIPSGAGAVQQLTRRAHQKPTRTRRRPAQLDRHR